jgi:hypothetical protein
MSRWILLLAVCLFVASPLHGQVMQTYTSDSGVLAFNHPTGWQVFASDRLPSRLVENYAVQPKGQDFAGQPGQVVVRIFDPMFVVEEARVRLPATPDDLFQRFVRAMPGGRNATFGNRTHGGVTYLFASETSDGFETSYAAIVTASGLLNVAGMATNPRETAQRLPLLFQMARSMSTPWPARPLDGAAQAVRNWYRVLRVGDVRALIPLACSEARASMLLASFASLDTLNLIARASIGFDFSGLRYETVASGSAGSVIRVAGNIVAVNGSVTPVYQSARILGGSNSLFVKRESGGWKVCGPVRGGYR